MLSIYITKRNLENNLDISIIIVSYNVKELLEKCLSSFKFFSEKIHYEIIIVENASSDGTSVTIREKFPNINLIINNRNKGFPAANNQAFLISKGKYILMLNPDTEFIDDSLTKMFDYLEKNESISFLAPKLLNTDMTIQNSIWRFPTLFSVFCESFHLNFLAEKKNYSDKNRNQIFEADSFSGASILFRRNIIDKIGMLDEKLFWIEDVDFCYRAKQAGLKLIYYPEAVVVHHIGQSAKKNYYISISNQVFNKIKFFRKYHSVSELFFVTIISFISVFLKIIFFFICSALGITYFLKFKAYVYTLPRIFNPPQSIT